LREERTMAARKQSTDEVIATDLGSVTIADTDVLVTEPLAGSRGGRPRRETVTPLQQRGIDALLANPTVAAAARKIGVNARTVAR
jgi:hypothetical protein